ncbi:branched-chain amino acid transport system carrier protein [Marinithermofilum abyssi]|uniref:Branched-chain amino acid transport system carrier protein n=1 Tax=Marinithermofilum abyssi TaxID=1571185 RepID=A0A8J2YEE5_9BACL|nr:branched-chain amino acid transport system II carrier protein [Marinithermofilum abyssi]GGE26229.1 branched-chain amino acid transport system carrier protein [Marinithermofilum abyssi]
MNQLSKKETLSVGLMLFALFFGAGNLIFPPALGQAAGTDVWPAILGFILTGVGLPLVGVIAIAVTGGNLQSIAKRVHPVFGAVFTFLIYLIIGPLFGIPRTASVAFEMGVAPFLPKGIDSHGWPLLVGSILFFVVTYWLCLNPSKLVDRIGNVLTPMLLGTIVVMLVQSILHPIGSLGEPTKAYHASPFFKGFMDGYLTMDTLGALVFGIVAVTAIQNKGVKDRKPLAATTIKAGLIAGIGLAFVYLTLGYMGATSQSLGMTDNGGQIMTMMMHHLFGQSGALLLGLAVFLACLTTSVGLVTATSMYFSKRFPSLSYNHLVLALCVAGTAVANMGLTKLIAVSVPVLTAIYPVAIVMILLTFLHSYFNGYRTVYGCALLGTVLISITDGLKGLNIPLGVLGDVYSQIPLYQEGIGWVLPAAIGAVTGYVWGRIGDHFSVAEGQKSAG